MTGPPEETSLYVEATTTPSFFQIMNGQRIEGKDYSESIATWRGRISDYEPQVYEAYWRFLLALLTRLHNRHEFLRDGENLAARMTGTIKVDGVMNSFESFMFAKVDHESGKMVSLIERAIWGPQ